MSALKRLGRVIPDHTHHAEVQEEVTKIGNDRGYCLLIVSMLENSLDMVLQRKVSHFNSDDRDDFFDSNGAAGSLSRKIGLVAAFGVVGPITHRNLVFIRGIRNSFAHAKVPMSFRTKEVLDVCEELQLINPLDRHNPDVADYTGGSARDRFHDVVSTTMMMLAGYEGYAIPLGAGVTATSFQNVPLP
jgi:hypothetical protein